MGWTPDQKRKSTENSYFYSIENYRAWASMMCHDAHSDSSYSLNLIIFDDSPAFFGLVEAGN